MGIGVKSWNNPEQEEMSEGFEGQRLNDGLMATNYRYVGHSKMACKYDCSPILSPPLTTIESSHWS